ncbi:hypothetical protein COCSADRAFT_22063 [Bipolaris sorokiniana ND90Pr]|uniref:Uncharacterized protein n=1 Tax=Cochliobolus sativus (strain ND90Pr / ATCC 201652) TaxID=665912 RepID=M2T650_COCSN|nr:uncharacterized protein COCSADRAFT_22063 [Bipolaris sorokiniana ND90Pr]EMD69905.1 hypothetical protein COCSADRAFT_22063 [Bipolaris sorokiniana ND90Pr]
MQHRPQSARDGSGDDASPDWVLSKLAYIGISTPTDVDIAESRRPVVLHVAQPEYRVAEKPNLRRRLISTEKAALLSNDLAGSELATKTIIAKQLIGSDACLQQLGIDVQVSSKRRSRRAKDRPVLADEHFGLHLCPPPTLGHGDSDRSSGVSVGRHCLTGGLFTNAASKQGFAFGKPRAP